MEPGMRPDQLIRRQLRRKLVQFFGDRTAATAVEFAVLAPVLFLAVIGIIELAVLLTVQVLLEGSVREASRFGITGYTPAGTTRDAQIRATIAQYTVGRVDMNNIVIVTRVFQSFGQIVRPEPCYKWLASGTCDTSSPQNYSDSNGNGHWDDGNGTNGSGGSGDIVLYTVHYRHQMMTGLMRRIMGINGWVALEASVLVRNEPW
jgi:Flp pilus assembly pilin Flp